jgi:hypothetical protein
MADKASFTPEEWTLLRRSPAMAGLVIVAASPSGPIGAVQEALAMGRILTEAKSGAGTSQLINSLAADLTSSAGGSGLEVSELVGKSPEQIRGHALETLRRAVTLVDGKAPAESSAFRRWLLTIGEKVAAAAREGGFLGIGGTDVSDQEKSALTDLGRSIGIAA